MLVPQILQPRVSLQPCRKGLDPRPIIIRNIYSSFWFHNNQKRALDIPVDVQVARFTFRTGCLKLRQTLYTTCIHEPSIQPAIEDVWREVAKSLDIALWQLDEPISAIGSKLCTAKNCTQCRVKDLCDKNFGIKIEGNRIHWE